MITARTRLASVLLLAAAALAPLASTPADAVETPPPMVGQVVRQVDAGGEFTCAVVRGGQGYCWGNGDLGVLGNGTRQTKLYPEPVTQSEAMKGEGFRMISGGQYLACGISESGKAFCWGRSLFGGLGIGDVSGVFSEPRAVDRSGVLKGKTLVSITAGANNACALDKQGRAYCWGSNFSGELGDGTTRRRQTPVRVDMSGVLQGRRLVDISLGGSHTCALDAAGRAYCWGNNHAGQLGIDSGADERLAPARVDTSGVLKGVNIVDVGLGARTSCAVGSNGRAYCWGRGALGAADTSRSRSPVAVDKSDGIGRAELVSVDSLWRHTCASAANGKTFCWGPNRAGQLGDGSTTASRAPVQVDAIGTPTGELTGASGGFAHGCAIDGDGAVYCWGAGDDGRLGTGSTADQLIPAAVQAPVT